MKSGLEFDLGEVLRLLKIYSGRKLYKVLVSFTVLIQCKFKFSGIHILHRQRTNLMYSRLLSFAEISKKHFVA